MIHQRYIHRRPKTPFFDRYTGFPQVIHKELEQVLGPVRFFCRLESRAPAFPKICTQSELRHDQGRASDIYETPVHPPGLILEDAQLGDLLGQDRPILGIIAFPHPQEDHEPEAYLARNFLAYRHLR